MRKATSNNVSAVAIALVLAVIGFLLWAGSALYDKPKEKAPEPPPKPITMQQSPCPACPEPVAPPKCAPGIPPHVVLNIVRQCREGTLDLTEKDIAILKGKP